MRIPSESGVASSGQPEAGLDGSRPRSEHPREKNLLSAALRVLAALVRWLLFASLVVVAPGALTIWSVTPRITSPSQFADQAIESGLTRVIRLEVIDQISTTLAREGAIALAAGELDAVIGRMISQEWFDTQIGLIAGDFDRWLRASGDSPPNLVIDITAVKKSLVADDQVVALLDVVDGACDELRCPSPDVVLSMLVAQLPDEVAVLTLGDESDSDPGQSLRDVRHRLQMATSLIAMVPFVLGGLLVAMVLLARRGSRFRWLGAVGVAISLPVLAAASLLPGWAAGRAAGSLPRDIAIDRTVFEDLFAWVARPAETLAWWILAAGVAALIASTVLSVLRRRL